MTVDRNSHYVRNSGEREQSRRQTTEQETTLDAALFSPLFNRVVLLCYTPEVFFNLKLTIHLGRRGDDGRVGGELFSFESKVITIK